MSSWPSYHYVCQHSAPLPGVIRTHVGVGAGLLAELRLKLIVIDPDASGITDGDAVVV